MEGVPAPFLKDKLKTSTEYLRLHEIMADRWHLATIFEDWTSDFPGTVKPFRSWKDVISSLVEMYLEGGAKAEKVCTAFAEGPEDTPFPFGIELKNFMGEDRPNTTRQSFQDLPFCSKCGKDIETVAFCAADGRRHARGASHETTRHGETDERIKEFEDDGSNSWAQGGGEISEEMIRLLKKVGGGATRYADALEKCGFMEPSRLEGVNPENLLGWVEKHMDMTPGDAVAIVGAAKKQGESKKKMANPDNAFDVRNFAEKLKKAGPDEILNTLHRVLLIGAGNPEKKRLFALFEHWLKILDRTVKAGRQEEKEDMINHGQEIINSIRALNANSLGKPGTALLAQVEAKVVKDDFGAAMANWETRGARKTDRGDGFRNGTRKFTGACFGCGKQGHRQSDCRNGKSRSFDNKKGQIQNRPSPRTSGGAGR